MSSVQREQQQHSMTTKKKQQREGRERERKESNILEIFDPISDCLKKEEKNFYFFW
jgi:hypothetical protein